MIPIRGGCSSARGGVRRTMPTTARLDADQIFLTTSTSEAYSWLSDCFAIPGRGADCAAELSAFRSAGDDR